MGVSIDLYTYDTNKLLAALEQWGATDRELTVKILEECGMFAEGNYILLNNEYYDSGSPYYNVSALFDAAFKKEDSFHVFLEIKDIDVGKREGISYVDLNESAEKLGITLPDED